MLTLKKAVAVLKCLWGRFLVFLPQLKHSIQCGWKSATSCAGLTQVPQRDRTPQESVQLTARLQTKADVLALFSQLFCRGKSTSPLQSFCANHLNCHISWNRVPLASLPRHLLAPPPHEYNSGLLRKSNTITNWSQSSVGQSVSRSVGQAGKPGKPFLQKIIFCCEWFINQPGKKLACLLNTIYSDSPWKEFNQSQPASLKNNVQHYLPGKRECCSSSCRQSTGPYLDIILQKFR